MEVMLGDEGQWFFGLLEMSMKFPENFGQIQFPRRLMFRSQFIESFALLNVVFRTNPQLSANLGSDGTREGITGIALRIIRKNAQNK